MRVSRNKQQQKLDTAMKANAALYLLDTLAEMLEQIPHVDKRLERAKGRWRRQLLGERNRMLPLVDKAEGLLHNVELTGSGQVHRPESSDRRERG
jgi:transposase